MKEGFSLARDVRQYLEDVKNQGPGVGPTSPEEASDRRMEGDTSSVEAAGAESREESREERIKQFDDKVKGLSIVLRQAVLDLQKMRTIFSDESRKLYSEKVYPDFFKSQMGESTLRVTRWLLHH